VSKLASKFTGDDLRPPRVWVTRPLADSAHWIEGLRSLGMDAQALPLMVLGPSLDTNALQATWCHLEQYHAIMFVSANAVRYFFQNKPHKVDSEKLWGSARAWVTGLGSRAALLQAGVQAHAIDSPTIADTQWDSEALWAIIAPQIKPGQRVLIVRGANAQGKMTGRDWLRSQLVAFGAQVDQVVAYQRHAPTLSAKQCQMAKNSASDGSIWLFSNSEAISHLAAILPEQDWSKALAVATHPRIAQQARTLGWGRVAIAQPGMESVASSIKSLYES